MHSTTDALSAQIMSYIASLAGITCQTFQIRNGSPSGGTIGPMLSSQLGIRCIDCGIPQLSMHSIRATTGSKDMQYGVELFSAVYKHWHACEEKFLSFDY